MTYFVENGRPTRMQLPGLSAARSGDQVLIAGIVLPGDGTIITDDVTILAATTPLSALGLQRTVVILASAVGAPSPHPYANKANTASLVYSSTSGQSLRAFITEASYGQATVVGGSGGVGTSADVAGPYDIARSCDPATLFRAAVTRPIRPWTSASTAASSWRTTIRPTARSPASPASAHGRSGSSTARRSCCRSR